MKEITQFLKDAGCFFLATADGDRPDLRPIGLVQEYDGKIYLGIGTHKKVYKQILANPNIAIVAMKPGTTDWVRVRAKAYAAPQEIGDRMLDENPHLKGMYNEETGMVLGALEVTDGEVEFCAIAGPERIETL